MKKRKLAEWFGLTPYVVLFLVFLGAVFNYNPLVYVALPVLILGAVGFMFTAIKGI